MTTLRIASREFMANFSQPIAYISLSILLTICGAYTFFLTPFFVIGEASVRSFFEFCPFVLTLIIPALTMGLIAEERRNGMLELLQTWPIGDYELLFGKFLGTWMLTNVAWVASLCFPITVSLIGHLDWGTVVSGYIGLACLSSANIALGLFASAVSRSQIVSYVLGFALCFGFYLIGRAAIVLPNSVGRWLNALSFENRFLMAATGVIELADLVFFVSISVMVIGLCAEILNSRRWL